jgi:3'-5' exoribonuclease
VNITDITPGRVVRGVFLVASFEVREARTGTRFLRMSLRDRAGATIDAVFFQVSDTQVAAVAAGQPYEIEGMADEFRNRVNIKVDAMRPSDETWDATDYLPRSSKSAGELTGAIHDAVESITSPVLKDVMQAVVADPLVTQRLPTWPAAKTRHHAWIGGLAEHTVEMLQIADRVASVYPQLDRDLLLAGVVLHDLGKLEELDLQASIVYSDAGNLEGHMVQGVRILDRALAATGCDGEIATLLRHLVLSHQGQLEYAAVTVPMLPEAIALHFIDQLSSQIRPAIEDVAAARQRGVSGAMLRGPTAMRDLYVRAED